ncbi:hypothetical protein [Methylobacterium haplocladii]|nr:hypothetical protein [Methylobacterium haplocladii]GJD85556.1 hypothetical protein HPGCJGGD_3445 [Methylobacterium haplocladii]
MALVSAGVPFDVAFSLDSTMRQALVITHGKNRGGEFDWGSWSWRRQDG